MAMPFPSRVLFLAAIAAALAACPEDKEQAGPGDAGEPQIHPDAPTSTSTSDGGTTGGDPDAGTPVITATPLTKSTFVFRRHQSSTADSLIAYDAASRQERLVTDLLDPLDPGSTYGTKTSGHSLSPDRTTLAFTAIFRVELGEFVAAQAVWVVGVDGQGFRRITPPLPNAPVGPSCSSDSDCPNGHCDTSAGECRLPSNINQVDDPAFTPDSKQILFDMGGYSTVGGSVSGGEYPWSVPLAGGYPTPAVPVGQCTIVSAVAPDPDGSGFVANHSVCLPSEHEGLYFHPADGTTPIEVVSTQKNQVDPSLDPPSWIQDGSGLVFVGTGMMSVGGTLTNATGVWIVDANDLSVHPLIAPDTAGQQVVSAAIAGDGSFIAYCQSNGSASDIFVADLRTTPATVFPATTDGKSCEPRF